MMGNCAIKQRYSTCILCLPLSSVLAQSLLCHWLALGGAGSRPMGEASLLMPGASPDRQRMKGAGAHRWPRQAGGGVCIVGDMMETIDDDDEVTDDDQVHVRVFDD